MNSFKQLNNVLILSIIFCFIGLPAFASSIKIGTEMCIMFEKSGTKIPSGYYLDSGNVYAKRINGLSYGWNTDHTKNVAQYKDAWGMLRAAVSMKKAALWEIDLPNGQYDLNIEMSDPTLKKVQCLNVEGISIVREFVTSMNTTYYFQTSITVKDGRLSFDNGDGLEGSTQINRIFIKPVNLSTTDGYKDTTSLIDSRGYIAMDVPKTHPYFNGIKYVIDRGILSFEENGYFNPEGKVNGFQFKYILAILNDMSGRFMDYQTAESILIQAGVLKKGDLESGSLTRLQLARLLSASQLNMHHVNLNTQAALPPDLKSAVIADQKAVQNMLSFKFMSLSSDGLFKPNLEIKRKELAMVLMRYHQTIILDNVVKRFGDQTLIAPIEQQSNQKVPANVIPDENFRKIIMTALGKSDWNLVTYGDLKSLTALYAQNANISSIEGINLLSSLVILDLSRNQLSYIPQNISDLKMLRDLMIGYNNIYELPDAFGDLNGLEALYMNSNNLRALPDTFGKLKNLKDFNGDDNFLETLPQSFSGLTSIEKLSLERNNLVRLPEDAFVQKSLKHLSLSDNVLVDVPKKISEATSLESINLSFNELTILPDLLGSLQNLVILEANHNRLTRIPTTLSQLEKLQKLSVSQNDIYELPDLSTLNSLRQLDLSKNKLMSLPDSLTQLKALEWLSVSSNGIEKVPARLIDCSALRDLSMSDNHITEIPEALFKIKTLKSMNFNNNRIVVIPSAILANESLEELYLQNNLITAVPENLLKMKTLRVLYLDNNRISQFPIATELNNAFLALSIAGNPIASNLTANEVSKEFRWFNMLKPSALKALSESFHFQFTQTNHTTHKLSKIWHGLWSVVWIQDGFSYNESIGHTIERVLLEGETLLMKNYFPMLKYPQRLSVIMDTTTGEAGAYGLGGYEGIYISTHLLTYDTVSDNPDAYSHFSTITHETAHALMEQFSWNNLQNKWTSPLWYNETLACSIADDWQRERGHVLTGDAYQYNLLGHYGFSVYGAKTYDAILQNFEYNLKYSNDYNLYRLFAEYLKEIYGPAVFSKINTALLDYAVKAPLTNNTSDINAQQLDLALKGVTSQDVFEDYVKWHKKKFTIKINLN